MRAGKGALCLKNHWTRCASPSPVATFMGWKVNHLSLVRRSASLYTYKIPWGSKTRLYIPAWSCVGQVPSSTGHHQAVGDHAPLGTTSSGPADFGGVAGGGAGPTAGGAAASAKALRQRPSQAQPHPLRARPLLVRSPRSGLRPHATHWPTSECMRSKWGQHSADEFEHRLGGRTKCSRRGGRAAARC